MDEKRTGAGPSGRAILLWGGGSVLLVAALALFGLYFVASALRAREIVRQAADYGDALPFVDSQLTFLPGLALADSPFGRGPAWGGKDPWKIQGMDFSEPRAERVIRQLGGAEQVSRALSLYVALPDRVAPDKHLAVVLLGWCGRPAVPGLARALGDPELRAAAAHALRGIGHEAREAVPALLAALDDGGNAEADLAAWDQGWAWERTSPNSWKGPTLSMLIGALGRVGPEAKAAAPRLKQLLRDKQPRVRLTAALALWRVTARDDLAVPVILKDFGMEPWWVPDVYGRPLARSAIAEIGGPAVPHLLKWLKSEDVKKRRAAARAFPCLDLPDSTTVRDALIAALADRDTEVRDAAARALGSFGQYASEALPVLEETTAHEPDRWVARTMIVVMKHITGELTPLFPFSTDFEYASSQWRSPQEYWLFDRRERAVDLYFSQ